MQYFGIVILSIGLILVLITESVLISVRKKINKNILEDIKKVKAGENVGNEFYQKDIEDFLLLLKTSTSILRIISLLFIVSGVALMFI